MGICENENNIKEQKYINQSNENIFKNEENILCPHCKRTSSNGIRCIGMCVADNDY